MCACALMQHVVCVCARASTYVSVCVYESMCVCVCVYVCGWACLCVYIYVDYGGECAGYKRVIKTNLHVHAIFNYSTRF